MRRDTGFTLIELLIVVAIIGILAAIAVPGLLRARMSGNESSAIGSMHAINAAEAAYAAGCGQGGYTPSLAILAAPCVLLPGARAYISPDLDPNLPGNTPWNTGVVKSGYNTEVVAAPAAIAGPLDMRLRATVTEYWAYAMPQSASAGQRGFRTSGAGTIFVDPTGGNLGTLPLH